MEKTINEIIKKLDGDTLDASKISDGYHTFAELYKFRKLYNALLFNEWAKLGKYNVVKSYKHSDGNFCFNSNGLWFIVVAETPYGQISNHYTSDFWDFFTITEVEKAPEFDGHTTQDVILRLEKTILFEAKLSTIKTQILYNKNFDVEEYKLQFKNCLAIVEYFDKNYHTKVWHEQAWDLMQMFIVNEKNKK